MPLLFCQGLPQSGDALRMQLREGSVQIVRIIPVFLSSAVQDAINILPLGVTRLGERQ